MLSRNQYYLFMQNWKQISESSFNMRYHNGDCLLRINWRKYIHQNGREYVKHHGLILWRVTWDKEFVMCCAIWYQSAGWLTFEVSGCLIIEEKNRGLRCFYVVDIQLRDNILFTLSHLKSAGLRSCLVSRNFFASCHWSIHVAVLYTQPRLRQLRRSSRRAISPRRAPGSTPRSTSTDPKL